MRRTLKFLFLPILAIGLFIYVYQSSLSPKLGLDLQGGISVILTADENTTSWLYLTVHNIIQTEQIIEEARESILNSSFESFKKEFINE